MKKAYTAPDFEKIRLTLKDVILASYDDVIEQTPNPNGNIFDLGDDDDLG